MKSLFLRAAVPTVAIVGIVVGAILCADQIQNNDS
jgi:hypothetical protein